MGLFKSLKKLDPLGSKLIKKTAKIAPKGSLVGAVNKKIANSGKSKTVAPKPSVSKSNQFSKFSPKMR